METLKSIIEFFSLLYKAIFRTTPKPIPPVPDSIPPEVKSEPKTSGNPYSVPNPSSKWGDYPEEKKDLLRVMVYKKCQGVLDYNQTINFFATIEAESGFNPYAQNNNKDGTFDIGATMGIAQLNSYWYLKPNNMTSEEAKENPEKCIDIMVSAWKRGRMNDWIAYKSGNYKLYIEKVRSYLPEIQKLAN